MTGQSPPAEPGPRGGTAAGRVDWVDYAKGFCIVFVVMMHSTLGVEQAAGHEGFMHTVVAFAKPFRMPDFFLISGLFLAQVIDRGWRTYLDRKVVHFVYFYLIWTALQFAFKAPLFAQENGVAGTAWLYVAIVLGAVRHALVHLSPADLLRRHQARPRLRHPARAGVAGGRRARERPDQYRLDRHRRVRGPLRVLLHRLSARPARLRPGGGRAGAAGDRRRGPHGLGADQRATGLQRALRAAGGVARPRAHRRHGGGHGRRP